jgi:aryl-alcohol dehydrogenase-like predicted oxidoreductase
MTFGSMADEATATACLDEAFDAGVDFIDTSEVYPVPPDPRYAGVSEEICGKWLASHPRDAVIVSTKVAGPGGGWFRAPVREGKSALDRHNIERAVESSLRRLQTDYIDLYQTHWPDPFVPIEATLEALDRLVEQGKDETIQNNYSILSRRFEDEIARVCTREQVSLLVYSPIGAGVLSGKYQGGAWPEGARFSRYREGDERTKAMTKRFVNERTLATAARVAEIAGDCGMSPVSFAVAWTLSRDFIGSTIVGVTSAEQLGEHLAAADAEIPGDALGAVDRLSKEIRHPME